MLKPDSLLTNFLATTSSNRSNITAFSHNVDSIFRKNLHSIHVNPRQAYSAGFLFLIGRRLVRIIVTAYQLPYPVG